MSDTSGDSSSESDESDETDSFIDDSNIEEIPVYGKIELTQV